MKLRDYQEDLIKKAYKCWADGAQNVLLQLPTGGGKTLLFCKIISECKDPVTVIAHRIELLSQVSLTLSCYSIRHNIISSHGTIREIINIQMMETSKSWYDPLSRVTIIGVDTLIRMNKNIPWIMATKLVIQDEAHHVLRKNKWGKAAEYFPQARGLYPTATPCRADGYGLGKHADGVIDSMINGPTIRELITANYLSEYKIYAPRSNIETDSIPITAAGDFSPPKLREAVHKSRIVGDVVNHYLKIAPGKLGVTFAVDIQCATEIAANYKINGIPAEIISSKTPELLRAQIMRQFRNREILQLVNVDLLGEGVDVPAIEVVSMARPTNSYALYLQQFGRALRPSTGKIYATIIDHVGNVERHRLPDHVNNWSLDRRERKSRGIKDDIIPVRTCLNELCLRVYEKIYSKCPYCGYIHIPKGRSTPAEVEGDLIELDPESLAKLRGEIARIDGDPRFPINSDRTVQYSIMNNHRRRQFVQYELRENIALWAGHLKQFDMEDSIIYRKFYFTFGIDIATAQTLNVREATELNEKLVITLNKMR